MIMTITPKKLYELAKQNNAENRPIFIYYACDDDYYNYQDELRECQLCFNDKERAVIYISNF